MSQDIATIRRSRSMKDRFPHGAARFLGALGRNNRKDWFDQHRSDYEERLPAKGLQARGANAEARAAWLRPRPSPSALPQTGRHLRLDRNGAPAGRLRQALLHPLPQADAAARVVDGDRLMSEELVLWHD